MTRNCLNVMRKVAAEVDPTTVYFLDRIVDGYGSDVKALSKYQKDRHIPDDLLQRVRNKTDLVKAGLRSHIENDPVADLIRALPIIGDRVPKKEDMQAASEADFSKATAEMDSEISRRALIKNLSMGAGGLAGAGLGAYVAGPGFGRRLLGGTLGGVAGLGAGYGVSRIIRYLEQNIA